MMSFDGIFYQFPSIHGLKSGHIIASRRSSGEGISGGHRNRRS